MKHVSFDKQDVILYYKPTDTRHFNDWEQHARDRVRFERRIQQLGLLLIPFLIKRTNICKHRMSS